MEFLNVSDLVEQTIYVVDDDIHVITEKDKENIKSIEITGDEPRQMIEIVVLEAELAELGNLIRQILCPYCGVWFADRSILKLHLNAHLDAMKLFCVFCERFYSKCYFRKHMEKHPVETFFQVMDEDGQEITLSGRLKTASKICKCCERAKKLKAKTSTTDSWDTLIFIDPSES
ncbi:PR domain zinc finger protein 5-like [Phlebotomus argentipes]|uniref:PR domain zinc finger protein 5-like n=1 Tax=Phlebotomus argentipes TaxID=94469 RepID=UPI002892B2BD|nr:PR domain zinc finger protein 5-like [Phlebotomus argentipes]